MITPKTWPHRALYLICAGCLMSIIAVGYTRGLNRFFLLEPSGLNLLIHLVNMLLVSLLTTLIVKNPWAGLVSAGLFGLHPSHAEIIAQLSGQRELLSAMLFLLSVLCGIRSRHHVVERHRHGSSSLFALLFLGCALLVENITITAPGIVLLYELILLTGWQRFMRDFWRNVTFYALYLLLPILYGILSLWWEFIPGIVLKPLSFESILATFETLAFPFGEKLFSSSLALNAFGITYMLLICLIFSKKSRFTALWIGITAIPYWFFLGNTGVYLLSIGFCILLAIILTLIFGQRPNRLLVPQQRLLTRPVKITIHIIQIAIIALFLFRYGMTTKAEIARQREIVTIREQIPLHLKALHANFPDMARICLENLPLDSPQEIEQAIRLRYPGHQFEKISLGYIEDCVKEEETTLQNIYFLSYQEGMLHDVTYESQDLFISQHQVSWQNAQLTLSTLNPSVTINLTGSPRCESLGLVTTLANSIDVPQGTLIARGQIEGKHGEFEEFELIAGQDTAEWAIRFPDIHKIVQHATPQYIYEAWTTQYGANFAVAQNYIKPLLLEAPFIPASLSLDLHTSPEISANLTLNVVRIIYYY